jgi:AcrR family transcriptional regulator
MMYHNEQMYIFEVIPMEKLDRRIRRTQQLLGDSLVSLIVEKGYEAVTIKDITDRADVAYVTFYRHYKDKDQLLMQRLQESLGELTEHIETAARQAKKEFSTENEGLLIFKHVQQHSTLYGTLLSSRGGHQGSSRVRKRTQDLIALSFLKNCSPLHDTSYAIPAEVAAHHIAASLLALIEWWLENDMPYSVERMAQIYSKLIISATVNVN